MLDGDLFNEAGSIDVQVRRPWVEVTADYQVEAVRVVYADATAGAITIDLPAAPEDKMMVFVKRINAGANAVTIDSGTGNLIDSAQTKVLAAAMDRVALQCVGIRGGGYQWWIWGDL